MELEKVLDSIKSSKVEIEKYFNLKDPEYHCDSGLLSNQINDIIDVNSNIAKFYSLFDVKDGPNAINDILNFVFETQECANYNELQENTTLQRKLKQQLITGKEFKIGWGKLKQK